MHETLHMVGNLALANAKGIAAAIVGFSANWVAHTFALDVPHDVRIAVAALITGLIVWVIPNIHRDDDDVKPAAAKHKKAK